MQGGKNWINPKEMNANRFFWDSHWLEIWSNLLFPLWDQMEGAWLWTQYGQWNLALGLVTVYTYCKNTRNENVLSY